MSKEEITLQLTLKLLDNFSYNTSEYGGNAMSEHATIASKIAYTIYNEIYSNITTKTE